MQPTTLLLAVAMAVVQPVFALPGTALLTKKDDDSWHCTPTGKADQYNSYNSYDVTSTCQRQPDACNYACVTFVDSSAIGCPSNMDVQDFEDMLFVIAQQINKDGWTKTSKRGRFLAAFDLNVFTTAIKDRSVLSEWNYPIQTLRTRVRDEGFVQYFPGTVYLKSDLGNIIVTPSC
ncbi:hypothetical protein TI39_contig4372g00011 [Zymoseptoria brevis]|uniref:Secreted protein n=1 Tax=Zymoseptoria brevis TaxID=1047168 RepID=A0A0F4G783_9PEZI|nr:hypothetical protein TI39_contig4372g00011 [Zymoseptoria brevis]